MVILWNAFKSLTINTYAGHFGAAYSRCCQAFSNFPGENCWVFQLAPDYRGDDAGGEEPRSASSNSFRLEEAGATVPAQDLTDAPVGHLKDAAESTVTCVFIVCAYLPLTLNMIICDTRSILEIWLGRTPSEASSIIFLRLDSGRGLPLRKLPPNWLILPPPVTTQTILLL